MTPDPATRRALTDRRSLAAVLAAAALAALFLVGTIVAPLLDGAQDHHAGWLRALYAPVCHQNPERCFSFVGGAQAICARCAGLYAGGVAGLFFAAWWVVARGREPRRLWLLLAVAPTAVDALLPFIGLPSLPSLPRHLLAWPAGFVAGLFLSVGLADLFRTPTHAAADRPLEAVHIP